MNSPIPQPRQLKKPVPTPRRLVVRANNSNENQANVSNNNNFNESGALNLKQNCDGLKSSEHVENLNTFSRRVSNASKQIAGDIGQLVQGKKTAIITGTRESLRRIKRTISNSPSTTTHNANSSDPTLSNISTTDYTLQMFNNIKFDSPLTRSNSIYSNATESFYDNPNEHEKSPKVYPKEAIYNNTTIDTCVGDSSSDDSISLPPPTHPPPPLPDESLYDSPSSAASSYNSFKGSTSKINQNAYEQVFPVWNQSDLSRSDSWKFYDVIAENSSEVNVCDIDRENSEHLLPQVTGTGSTEILETNQAGTASDEVGTVQYSEIDKAEWQSANKYGVINRNKSFRLTRDTVESCTQTVAPQTSIQKCVGGIDLSKIGAESYEGASDNDRVETGSSASSGKLLGHLRTSVYENHEIIRSNSVEGRSKVSKSVILQFDPLRSNLDCVDSSSAPGGYSHQQHNYQNNDIRMLEELLQGDLYGNISDAHTIDNWSLSDESQSDDFLNPPTPPARVDSLPDDEQKEQQPVVPPRSQIKHAKSSKSRTSWFTNDEEAHKSTENNEPKKTGWLKSVKEVLEKTPDRVRGTKNKDHIIERPVLGMKSFVQKRGMLYKVQNGPVEDLFGEYSGRWCVLENSNFLGYADNTCSNLKEHFPAQHVLSIQILQDSKYRYKYDNDDLHCFELNVTGKSRGGHIYGSRNSSERRIWMQLIAEALTNRFKSKLTTNFTRMGWAYIREGVSGKWMGAWLILCERELHYGIDGHSVKTMDLRKARCIVLHSYHDGETYPRTSDKGPNMLVDCPNVAVYFRMWTSRETKVWCHIVKLDAHNNGANLDQQQLTKNDIPVIVEKCINFIYAHGSMSEGIYRRSGQGSSISELLSKFRKDAFAVQLTTNTCNEHEVASVLKRFFRDLPEPLFGIDHRQYLYEVSKHNVKEEKIRMFKAALDQLPPVSYKTARKLLGHLHFISMQSDKNLMTVENLASIWGPTLMHYEDKESTQIQAGQHNRLDTEVVAQLVRYYRHIFPEDPGELDKEKIMLKVLQKHLQSPQGSVVKKTAGDFRVWIFLYNKEGKSYNVAIGPSKTAYDVCLELSDQIKMPVHELVLEEIVLSDRLIRPIHFSEKVLDVVLKWSYWDDCYRKENYLTIAALSKYWEYLIEKPLPVSGELKFADAKSRLFKTYNFHFTQCTLTCFKDKTGDTVINSWKIEDITWYLGHESKRTPQSRWTITFLTNDTHPVRNRSTPYFGNVLVWPEASARANWLSAMLKARYPNNLAPPPNFLGL